MKQVLWVGFGAVGVQTRPLLLARDFSLTGVKRSPHTLFKHPQFEAIQGNALEISHWQTWLSHFPDIVIISLSAKQRALPDYLQAYYLPLVAFKQALFLSPKTYHPKVIFVSSSSVYGENQGNWVTELSPPCPNSDAGKTLYLCEQFLQHSFRTGFILRASGIYSDLRNRSIERLKYPRQKDTSAWVNRVHETDFARAIAFFCERLLHQQGWDVINITDNEPLLHMHFEQKTCFQLLDSQAAMHLTQVNLEGKRISNRVLRELGFYFKYPTFINLNKL